MCRIERFTSFCCNSRQKFAIPGQMCMSRVTASYWLLLLGGIVQSVSCNCGHFLVYCASYLSSNHPRFIHLDSLLWFQQRHLVAKWGNWARMAAEFCLSVSLLHFSGNLTCRKNLRHWADGFTSPPKAVVLRIFIALKNPSPSAGFEHANLWSNVTVY
jgi:hypothetical protein